MRRYARFHAKGLRTRQVSRYGLGIVGLMVIYFGLDVFFALVAEDETLGGYLLRYARYACVGLWATFGAPWTFLKLKLSEPDLGLDVGVMAKGPTAKAGSD